MNDKFYIKTIIRDDGERITFDEREIYLSADNLMLVRPDIDSSEVAYTDVDGGEMIRQKLPPHEQIFNGIIYPRENDFWDLYFKVTAFFKINHYYNLIYVKRSGEFFAQQRAWMSRNLQLPPLAREDYSTFNVGFKVKNSWLFEYAEDSEGNEIYANSITLPLLSASIGGESWDDIGQKWDSIGSVWDAGDGGVQEINVNSVESIYPIWTVKGSAVNPSLQNNTTDTIATYDGTVATGQTLVVDFSTGIARLDGAIVSRNIFGQVRFTPGANIVGFNADGGTVENSLIEWNNIIG